MSDFFCQSCALKPNWPWDQNKAFIGVCQRCFQTQPVNDYAWKFPRPTPKPAPKPNDLVTSAGTSQSECKLPPASSHPPVPQPVYEVPAPNLNDADKMLDAVQGSNRKGIKLQNKSVS